MTGSDPDRDVLFAALLVQAGLLDAAEVVAACEAWPRNSGTSLAEHLVHAHRITTADREAVEHLLTRRLEKHGSITSSLRGVALPGPVREALCRLGPTSPIPLTQPPTPRGGASWLWPAVSLLFLLLAGSLAVLVAVLYGREQAARGRLDEVRAVAEQAAKAALEEARLREEAQRRADEAERSRRAAEEAARAAQKRAVDAEQQTRRADLAGRRDQQFLDRMLKALPDLANHPGFETVRKDLLEEVARQQRELDGAAPADPAGQHQVARALLRLAAVQQQLGDQDAASRSLEGVVKRLEPLRDQAAVRTAVLADLATAKTRQGTILLRDRRFADAEPFFREAVALGQALVKEDAENTDLLRQLGEGHRGLAEACRGNQKWDDALTALRAAEPVLKQLAVRLREPETRAQLAGVYSAEAEAHKAKNRPAEAIQALRQGVPLRQKLCDDLPDRMDLVEPLTADYVALADALVALGQHDEAETLYARAVPLIRRVAKEAPKDAGVRQREVYCLTQVASRAQYRKSKPADAIEPLAEARAVLEQLVTDFPERTEFVDELTGLLINLGNAYQDTKRFEDAEKCFRDGIANVEKGKAPETGEPGYRRGTLHYNLGNLYGLMRKPAEAEKEYRSAIDVLVKVEKADPKGIWTRRNLTGAHLMLGNLLQDRREFAEAERCFTETIRRLDGLAADFPQEWIFPADRAMTYYNMGNLFSLQKQFEKAEKSYEAALKGQQALYQKMPGNARIRNDLANTQWNLANRYQETARLDEAEKLFNSVISLSEVLALQEREPQSHLHRLGIVLYNKGNLLQLSKRYKEARESYERALKTQTDILDRFGRTPAGVRALAETENNLAMLLADCPDEKQRDVKKALEHARKGVELQPRDGNYQNTLGVCLYRTGDWKASREGIEKAMELRKGGDAYDWYFLAMALAQLGEKGEARKWLEKADRWTKDNAPDRDDLKRYRQEAVKVMEP